MRNVIDTRVLSDPGWRHWAITIPLLIAHLAGAPWAMTAAMGLCVVMALYYLIRIRRLRPFPVQVRLAYLAWLLMGLLPYMQWMHYVALVGTTAMVLVGYCPLIRMLSLLGFNRDEPFTWFLLRRVILAPPSGGLFRMNSDRAAVGSACSTQSLPHSAATGCSLAATSCSVRNG